MADTNPHDSIFKKVYSVPENAIAHFRTHLPPAVQSQLRLETVEVVKGSFVDKRFAERRTDLLYSVQTKAGGQALVYLLFEHQSTPDALMPFRLLAYMVRIWEWWLGLPQNKNAHRVPFIAALVLYHGRQPWTYPISMEELFDIPEHVLDAAKPHVPSFTFVLRDLSQFTDDQLMGGALFGLVELLLKHIWDGDLLARLPRWAKLFRSVCERPSGLEAIELLLRYIMVGADVPHDDLVQFVDEHLGTNVKEVVMTLADRLREEGRAEGRDQGRQDLLLRLLALRFGELPDSALAHVRSAAAEKLDMWAENVLTAASLDEVFEG